MDPREAPAPPAAARRSRPEVLAPAGDPLSLRAGLASGADAVYLGMARFNARGRAERFRGLTLRACIEAAHERGARVYVTLNTLLHDDELPAAVDLAVEAAEAGADAAIIQDFGFASVLRERLPALPLHGSTQMTIHQPEQAAALVERLGLRRVIVARECTLPEVARIAERIRPLGAEAEVFVHGALCFAYSGQCLMSNFAGRRSANRGICAQNCRFDFSAGAPVSEGFLPLPVFEPRRATQLLSMKDLAAFESVAALAGAGVGSFKIEGRLKGPSYVAEVVRLYRAALDAWEAGRPFAAAEAERAAGRVYSRGFTNGYLAGRIDPSMRGDKRCLEGEPDATVLAADRKAGLLLLDPRPGHTVRAGQGYRYTHQRYRGGFRVIGARAEAGPPLGTGTGAGQPVRVRVRFGSEATGRRYRRGATGRRRLPPPLPVGLALYLNDDPELEERVRGILSTVEVREGNPPVDLRLEAAGAPGERLQVRARTADGRSAEASSPEPLEAARARPTDGAVLEEHLGRLGGTGYRLESLDSSRFAPGGFLRFPALHALRKALVAQLDLAAPEAGREPRPRTGLEPFPVPVPAGEGRERRTGLGVIVGSPEALRAALRAGAERVAVEDPLLLEGEREREERWREALRAVERPWFRLAPIAHDEGSDRRTLDRLHELFPGAGALAGHPGQIALSARAGLPAAADLYLNAYNHRTAGFLRSLGAVRITLSLEVEAKEAARVAARVDPGTEIEVVVGGAVFSMLTRQGYGLERGERLLALSEHGHAYRFEPSASGTTLYEARELVGAEALPELLGKVDGVRLDLAHQRPEAVEEIVRAYRRALDGGPVAAARDIHLRHAPHGSFQGHLFRGARALDKGESET